MRVFWFFVNIKVVVLGLFSSVSHLSPVSESEAPACHQS